MSHDQYFVIRYDSTHVGCPTVLTGFFNVDEFEWDPLEPHPCTVEINHAYVLTLSGLDMPLAKLDFDFYQLGGEYVSQEFLALCDELQISYRAIPLEIVLKRESRARDFFIFLPGESLAALDLEKSMYKHSTDIDTGRVIESPLYPGGASYDAISHFVPATSLSSDLFRCQETLELFCSERFKAAAHRLKGLTFEPVDAEYRYDAWAAFADL